MIRANFWEYFLLNKGEIYTKKVARLVEAVAKEMPKSIATQGKIGAKGAKKSNASSSFANFIKDLGKTTTLQKRAESNPINLTNNFIKVSDTGKSSAIKKDEMLSNLLKGKTQETPKQVTQNPLDYVLSRPKATHTKLNATPEIKQPKEAEVGRFSNRDATLRNLKGTNISFEKSKDSDFSFVKTADSSADSAKNSAIPSPSDLQKIGQNAPKNEAKNSVNVADSTPKDLGKQNLQPQDLPKNLSSENAKDSHPKAQTKVQTPQDLQAKITPKLDEAQNLANNEAQNLGESKAQTAESSANIAEISDELPNITQMTQDLAQNKSNTPSAQTLQTQSQNNANNANQAQIQPQNAMNAQDLGESQNAQDLQELAQTQAIPQDKAQDSQKSFTKLGIANTLKYGAFKAFDALSLLKPSDGKKLSELIKKADELSLNLQSVKYTKMAQTPLSANYFANQLQKLTPKMSLETNAPNLANQSAKNPQDSALSQILEQKPNETPKDSPKTATNNANNETLATKNDSPKIADNGAKNSDNNSDKNSQNNVKDSSQNAPKTAESKAPESKIAELKMPKPKAQEEKIPESPIKNNADSKENSDLKPVNFKVGANNESKIQAPKTESNANQNAIQNNNAEVTQNLANAEQSAKVEQLGNKLFDARETMRHFAQNLRSEIQNYKPPLSKITLELQPANLGSVEVSIISQGKNIQIQLNASQNTLNLFIQNQSDLRQALAQIGYENVAMSFSNGSQMGFSDNNGKWKYESQRFSANKSGNAFGLNNSDEQDNVFEIMITNNYA